MKSNSVEAIVRVKMEKVAFTELTLEQCFFDHHRFSVSIDHRVLGESEVFGDPDQKLALIGETLTIDLFEGTDPGESYTFLGRITDVRLQASAGMNGLIRLTGFGDSVKLERGKMLQTFSRTNLQMIFSELTENVSGLPVSNNPRYKDDIEFSFQYFETDWQYLCRLAKIYHETLFWDGYKVVWGDYAPKTVNLTYDHDLKDVELSSRMISNKFEQYYHEVDNKVMKHEEPFGDRTFPGIASKKSDLLNLMKKPLMPADAPVTMKSGLDNLTKARKLDTVNSMICLSGATKIHKVSIGCFVNVKLPKEMNSLTLGTYRVTNIVHYVNERGEYRNEFSAIPAANDYIPCPDFPTPVAQTLQATVVDNVDLEQGLGRIQVSFPFEKKACYHWFKRMTPDGGNGNTGKGRGYVFVPERNDEVYISFIDGNPEKPFVLGSVFHGNNADTLGGPENNYYKSIVTRSGHTIEFNDTDNSETIKIKDINENEILYDTRSKTITVSTLEKINLVSKIIQINASEDLLISVGRDMQQSVGNNLTQSTSGESRTWVGKSSVTKVDSDYDLIVDRNILTESGKNTVMQVGNKLRQDAENNIDVTSAGGTTNITSKGQINLKSNVKVHIK